MVVHTIYCGLYTCDLRNQLRITLVTLYQKRMEALLMDLLILRLLMSYIYGAPILDVSRSHTTTQHSR